MIALKVLAALVRKLFNRISAAVILVIAAVGLFMYHGPWQKMYSAEELRAELAEINPEALKSFDLSINKLGQENMLCSYRFYQGCYGKSAIHPFALDMAGQSTTPRSLARAYALLGYEDIKLSKEQRRFLDQLSVYAVNPAYEVSDGAKKGAQILIDETLKALESARKEGGDTWEIASRDMMSGMAYMVFCAGGGKRNRTAWEAYCQNVEWMSDALMLLYMVDTPELEIADAENWECNFSDEMAEFVTMCTRYPSMAAVLRETIDEWKEAIDDNHAEHVASYVPVMLEAYRHYGPQLEILNNKARINPKDSLSVILLNRKIQADKDRLAEDIYNVHNCGGIMWEKACLVPEFLSLYHVCNPELLREVLEACPDSEGLCCMVLNAAAEDSGEINAVAAANLVKALAYYQMEAINGVNNEAALKSCELPKLLASDWRVPAFLADHPQDGIELLRKDFKWLDKEYKADGRKKGDGVVGSFPFVGGVLVVGMNMAKGYPNTWGEIGWAAWDIVEDSLTLLAAVSTGGAGGVAVKGGGALAKAVGRGAGRTVWKKEGATYILNEGGKKALAQTAMKRVPKLGMRCLDRWLGRNITAAGKKVMKDNLARAGKIVVKNTWKGLTKSAAFAKYVGTSVYSRIGVRGVAGCIACAMICVDVCQFVPHLGEFVGALAREGADILAKVAADVVNGLVKGLAESIAQNLPGGASSWWNIVAGSVLLLFAAFLLMSPKKKGNGLPAVRRRKIYSGV